MTVLDFQTLALMEELAVTLLLHLYVTVPKVIQAIVVKLAETYVWRTLVNMAAGVNIALVVTMDITANAYPGPGVKCARKILMNATTIHV
jgi:hypothetical protein